MAAYKLPKYCKTICSNARRGINQCERQLISDVCVIRRPAPVSAGDFGALDKRRSSFGGRVQRTLCQWRIIERLIAGPPPCVKLPYAVIGRRPISSPDVIALSRVIGDLCGLCWADTAIR